MPNRIIREAILSSEKIASLGWPEEVFYRRLLSIVDDYGRTEANPQLLRARCYPLQVDAVRTADITRWMAACQKAGVLLCYVVLGKQFIEVINFGQQQRSPSKWPAPPPVDINCSQVISSAHLVASVFEGVSVSDTPKAPKGADGRFEEFWKAYPVKTGKDAARKAFEKRKPDAELLSQMLSAINAQKSSAKWVKDGGQFIPNPATWLNQGRWQDGADGDGSAEIGQWHETRGGVDAKAMSLGIVPWDGIEQWVFFRARVIEATKAAA